MSNVLGALGLALVICAVAGLATIAFGPAAGLCVAMLVAGAALLLVAYAVHVNFERVEEPQA